MNVKSLQPFAFVVSLLGLLGLLWVNLATLFGMPPPFEVSFFTIFLSMFPLWAFTIVYLQKTRPPIPEADANQMSKLLQIQYYLGNPPNWAMIVLALFYAYMLYSAFLYLNGGSVDPEYVNGQYQFNNHGNIRYFTEEEYQVQHRLHLRSITGGFMGFFAVSTVALGPWGR